MSIKYICDRCKKEITREGCYKVEIEKKNVKTLMPFTPTDWNERDLCKECAEQIVRTLFGPENNQDIKWNTPEHLTNMDKLMGMPKEELAQLLSYGRCNFCIHAAAECDMAWEEECEPEILKWLNQEVHE